MVRAIGGAMTIPICFAIVAFAIAYLAVWGEEKRQWPRTSRNRRR